MAENKNIESASKSIIFREGNIEVNGQRYRLKDGVLYDSTGISVPKSRSERVLYEYYSRINCDQLDETQLIDYAKGLKDAGFFQLCVQTIEKELKKEHEDSYIKIILPIYTSSLRGLKQPNLAVEFWKENCGYYHKCESVSLLTSLAAAYLDLKDYGNAKKFADKAYARNGGGVGYVNELSLVYKRLKKETEKK